MRAALRISALTCTLAAAVAMATSSPTAARPRQGTIAIVSLQITGDAVPELRPALQQSLSGGLAAGGLRVVSLDSVLKALQDTPELIGCSSTTCLVRIGEKVGANYFLRARVETSGAAYTIELELMSANVDGGVIGRVERACPVCTIAELNDLASAAARDLVVLPPAKPVPIRIATDPEGAELRVDETVVGSSPFEGLLDPGTHRITASLDGYVTSEQQISVAEVGAEPQEFAVVLAPKPGIVGPEQGPDDRDTGGVARPYRAWRWVTAIGAVAAIGSGIALVAIDGDGTCDLAPGQMQCEQVRATLPGGLIAIAAGAGLGGVSVWMFHRDKQDRARARIDVAPAPGGAMGSLTVRF